MISMYKWKKNATLIMLGMIPLVVFILLFFMMSIKTFSFEGMKLTYIDITGLVLAFIFSIVAVMLLFFIGNKWLRHSFTKMLEGKGLVALVLDSTGLIGNFNVKINAPDMMADLPTRDGIPIEDTYDTEMQHRLMVPQDADMSKAYRFKQNKDGEMEITEEVDVLVLPKGNEKYDKLFSFENRPVFIYNKVMGKFLSRDALAKFEKDIEIKHSALNVLRKIINTDIHFRDFGRYIGENIKPGKKGLLASHPIIKWILIAMVVGMVAFIMILFIPGFLQAGSNLSIPSMS